MDRAYSMLTIKAVDEEQRVIRGIASTPTVDRVGDVVEPMGAQFKTPMALLLDHDHTMQVGHVTFAKPSKSGIPFEAKIVRVDEPGEVKNLTDKAWHLAKHRLRSFVSIGFRGLENGVERMKEGGLRFKAWEWLELSLVTIPANAEAVIFEAKSLEGTALRKLKSIDHEALAASGQEESKSKANPAASGTSETPARRKPMARKSYAERIVAFEETLNAKRAEMSEIMDAAEEAGRTLDTEEKGAYDELEREVVELREHVKRLKVLQADDAAKAKPIEGADTAQKAADLRAGIPAQVKAPEPEKGIRFARYAKCIGIAHKTHRDPVQIAQEMFGERDPKTVDVVKAAVIASNTTTDAALIGNEGGWADFVEFLRPRTILGRFGQDGVPALTRIPFRVPLITESVESAAYWVGEGKAKPLTKPAWTRTEMNPLKVANIAVATMEQLRDSSPSGEMLIRNSLANAIVKAQDQAFIDPTNAGTANVKPAAVTNGLTAVVSGGQDADAIRDDARRAIQTFVTANNQLTSGVWIMSAGTALAMSTIQNPLGAPEFSTITMNGGTFMGLPVITSQYVGAYVALVNAEDIYLGDEGGIMVDMSTEASLEMMDNPTGDAIAPVAASLVSLWQTNSVGFRAERTVNWMRRRATAVALISGVTWGVGAS